MTTKAVPCPEDLLTHSGFGARPPTYRRPAAHLTIVDAAADDLVQETWLAALGTHRT